MVEKGLSGTLTTHDIWSHWGMAYDITLLASFYALYLYEIYVCMIHNV